MSWGYLGEFWNAITEEIIGGITYTIVWFESIGNAVAGAIGGFFEDLIHHIYDVFYSFEWFLESFNNLMSIIFQPLTWILNFGKGFLGSAFSTAEELGLEKGDIGEIPEAVFVLFDTIPYFNYIMTGAGAVLGIIFLAFIIKRIAEI